MIPLFSYADWAIAVLVIFLASVFIALGRWWVFPVVGAVIGTCDALILGTLSHSPTTSVLLVAFLVPIEAALVGYCQNPTAFNLTITGLWLAFVIWVLHVLPSSSSDTLRLSAFVLPVMFLFLLLTIVAYRKGSVSSASRGIATIELHGVLMFVAAAFAFSGSPDYPALALLIVGTVLGFLGVWGILPAFPSIPGAVEKASEPVPAPGAPAAAPRAPAPSPPGRQYCPSCGSDNEGDSAFCRKCGRALAPAPAAAAGTQSRGPE
jgi:hypothetical protein